MKAFRFALLVAGLLLLRPPESAAQAGLFWDTQPASSGAQGGSGNWLGTNFWNNVFPGDNVPWIDGATASFSGTPGTVTVNGPVTANRLNFNVNGYTIGGGSTLTLGGATPNIFVNIAGSNTAAISAPIGGNAGFVKAGVGTLTLSGAAANSYTGLATVTDGTLNLSKTGVNALTGNLTIGDGTGGAASAIVTQGENDQIPNTATVRIEPDGFWNLGNRSETIGALTMLRAGSVDTGQAMLTLNGDLSTFDSGPVAAATISGLVDLGGASRTFLTDMNTDLVVFATMIGRITKTGAGTLTLTGSGDNNLNLTVADGIVILSKQGQNMSTAVRNLVIGDGIGSQNSARVVHNLDNQIAFTSQVTIATDGLWDIGPHAASIGGLTMTGGTAGNVGRGALTLSFGSVTATSSASAAAFINVGQLDLGGATRVFDIALGPNNSVDLQIATVITNGGVTKIGSGRLSLIPNNTFTGPIAINGGTVLVASVSDSGMIGNLGAGNSISFDGGALALTGATDSTNRAVTLNAGGGTVDVTTATTTLTMTGAFSGAGGLTKAGTGMLTLDGTPTYAGTTLITAGTLALNGGIAGAAGNLMVNAPGTLQARTNVNRAIGGDGTITATGTLIIGDASSASGFVFNGTLSAGSNVVTLADADVAQLGVATTLGAGGRIDAPNGAILTGGRSIIAATSATAAINGNLTNNGTLNGPTMSGQLLSMLGDVNGTGNYTGNVRFSAQFSPGSSAASVSLENFQLDPTSTLRIELGGVIAGSEFDQLNFTGIGVVDGTLNVSLINGFNPRPGSVFAFIRGGLLSGSFDTMNLPPLDPGFSWSYSQTANTAILAVVPEPACVSLLTVAAFAMALVRRRGVCRHYYFN